MNSSGGFALQSNEALIEIAAILAEGILRRRIRTVATESRQPIETPADSSRQRLEVSTEAVLTVSNRVNGDPKPQPRRDTCN
jgi:hypothetical protein